VSMGTTSRESELDLPSPTTLVVLATIFCVLLAGCSPPRAVRLPVTPEEIIRANELSREADNAFARRDFYSALIKYLEAGRLNPNSEYLQNKLGITYSQLKYYPEATAAFTRAIGLNPKYPFAYNNLGTVYFAMGEKRHAERYFKKAIGTNSQIASFHINLGSLYMERNKYDKGMEEWKKGLALDPGVMSKSDSISLAAPADKGRQAGRAFLMARLFASQGDADRAIDHLQAAFNNGFTDFAAILAEKDFDPIRQNDRFIAFMKTAALLSREQE
jgi:tetratricopeptide (TPR) repeat protein